MYKNAHISATIRIVCIITICVSADNSLNFIANCNAISEYIVNHLINILPLMTLKINVIFNGVIIRQKMVILYKGEKNEF